MTNCLSQIDRDRPLSLINHLDFEQDYLDWVQDCLNWVRGVQDHVLRSFRLSTKVRDRLGLVQAYEIVWTW